MSSLGRWEKLFTPQESSFHKLGASLEHDPELLRLSGDEAAQSHHIRQRWLQPISRTLKLIEVGAEPSDASR